MLPPGGTDTPALSHGRVLPSQPLHQRCWASNNEKTEQTNKLIYPNSTTFIFVYEQASTSLQVAFQLVEKWEQLNKHKGSFRFWKHCRLPFWVKSSKKKDTADNLRFSSVSTFSLQSHNLTWINTQMCVSRTLKPPHACVTTVWLQFSLSGSGLESTHFHSAWALPRKC